MNLKPPFDRMTIEPGKTSGAYWRSWQHIPADWSLFEDYPATVDGTIDLYIDAA